MRHILLTAVVSCFLILSSISPSCSQTIFVKKTGSDSNSGLNWSNAKATITAGLLAASDGGQVRVAQGVYDERISMKQGVALYGGFPPNGGSWASRNSNLYQTIIDGSSEGSVVTVPAGVGCCTIDGFIIQNGLANEGGGIYCDESSSLTVSNNVIKDNSAHLEGGGIFCAANSTPTIIGNTITQNSAPYYPEEIINGGGGILCSNSAAPMIIDNVISQNSAYRGGGVSAVGASPTISGNTITGNGAQQGGGVFSINSSSEITDNVVEGNSASAIYGTAGAGIFCEGGGAVVSDNIIRSNTAWGYYGIHGAGVSCGGDMTLSNNLIVGHHTYSNSYRSYCLGGGVYCSYGSPTIVSNTILGNRWEGIYCGYGASPTISGNVIAGNSIGIGCEGGAGLVIVTNNTIAYNDGSGLYLGSADVVSNNIVAFNGSGVSKSLASGNVTLRNNCVYGNSGQDYVGHVTPGIGDISLDPKMAGAEYGKIHLQPDSPCIDAGWDGAPGVPDVDIDGQPRRQDGNGDGIATIDIGADESDGTLWTGIPKIVRVSTDGSDNNAGDCWLTPKKTIQSAVDAISEEGGEVWVRSGTYYEYIVGGMYTYIYGGFSGTETERSERDWESNATLLDGEGIGDVVTFDTTGRLSAIDGFTIKSGNRGIYLKKASTVIENNTITENERGIHCYLGQPSIESNTISGNSPSGGIYADQSRPIIRYNSISGNEAVDGGGIWLDSFSGGYISHNLIRDNQAFGDAAHNGLGGAVCCGYFSHASIVNNTFIMNSARFGGAIHVSGAGWGPPTTVNNTLIGNSAEDGGALYGDWRWWNAQNNIIAFNSSGVYGNASPVSANCFYGNTDYDYSDGSFGSEDVNADPRLVSMPDSTYRLKATSPCIDAGRNDAPSLPEFALDGSPRISGGAVDIGADEYQYVSQPISSLPAARAAVNNTWIDIDSLVVSAAFTDPDYEGEDFFYIGKETRECGIRVQKQQHGMQEHARVRIEGVVRTNANAERYIHPLSITPSGTGAIEPLWMPNSLVGGGDWPFQDAPSGQKGVLDGVGLNNIGLLVRTSGVVTHSQYGLFYINDGSGLNDGSGHIGIKVYGHVPLPWSSDPVGEFVTVTGISSCEKPGDDIIRVIRTRGWSDIIIVD